MKILFNFLISITLFIYGIQLFSAGLEKLYQKKIQDILKKYTKTPLLGIIFGTITTALIQSSTLTTTATVGLVNSGIITFHNSLGLIMGANLGTCLTSWFIAILNFSNEKTILLLLNPNTYIPLFLIIALIFNFQKKTIKGNILMGLALFMLGLMMLNTSLAPIKDYAWFKNLLVSFNNPFIGVITGLIATTLIQSSSATVAILQTISKTTPLTYKLVTPIIMGENIGSCLTVLVASINTKKNAQKVALSHLLYNILGTLIFLVLFLILQFFQFSFLDNQVDSFQIAFIHTMFNFLSIIIFYPFLNYFENLLNKLVK